MHENAPDVIIKEVKSMSRVQILNQNISRCTFAKIWHHFSDKLWN